MSNGWLGILVSFFVFGSLVGCDVETITPSPSPTPIITPTSTPTSTPTPTPTTSPATEPKPGTWPSEWNVPITEAQLSQTLTQTPEDIAEVCPHYQELPTTEKEDFWVIFFMGLAKVESDWNRRSRYVETTMGPDAVTGLQIVSEGLLQLSYQDQKYYGCDFDWIHDRPLQEIDLKHPQKTIFDPIKNISCAMVIFKSQIRRKHKVFTASYWSPLLEKRSSAGYQRLMTYLRQNAKFCQ